MGNGILTGKQLHTMFENCDYFVFYLEKINGIYEYKYVNPAAAIIFKNESPIDKSLHEMVENEDTLKQIIMNYDEALNTMKQVIYRDFYLFSNTNRTNETTVIPVEGGGGVIAITKEVPKTKAIEEENHFLSSLFENTTNPILVLDNEFRVIKTNELFDTTFFSGEKMLGKYFDEFCTLDEKQKNTFYVCLTEALAGYTRQLQFNMKRLNKKSANFNVSFNPVVLENKVVAVSVQCIEYTRNVELQQTLKETNSILKAYQFALDEAANFCITDYNGIIEYVSPGYAKLAHYEVDYMIGKSNMILNSRQQSKSFYEQMWKTIKSGDVWRGEICNMSQIGTHYWVDTTIVPMHDVNGEIKHFLSICLDVTDKRVLMTNLRNIERTFRLITENTNDFIVITNEDGIILYVSPNHESRLGYEKEELLGRFYDEVLTEESNEILRGEINNILLTDGDAQIEVQLLTKSGDYVWIEAHVTIVEDADREDLHQFVIIAREITQRKQKEDELRFMAYHDSLTLLPNRRFIMSEFPKLVKQSINFGYAMTLLYIDGDNFKRINDVYGHDIGDAFINQFGQALIRSVRDHDIVARVGGDEFIIMLTHMSKEEDVRDEQILQTIQRIQKTLRKGWMLNGQHFSPTSSIGVSSYPTNGESINELMIHADEALYIAKKINGKDSYHISQE